MSSNTSTTEHTNIFSSRRYFMNNLNSYHGECILKELCKILEKNSIVNTEQSLQMIMAEDAEPRRSAEVLPSYEIIGTVSNPNIKSIDNVTRIVSRKECLSQMLTCSTVILDISCNTEELQIAKDYIKLLKDFMEKESTLNGDHDESGDEGRSVSKQRYLILISTVMTWANTKPLDPDTPDLPFVETDFRKRKPHPNYKEHLNIENDVIGIARKYKSYIGALVVCCGMTYGGREDVLYYWFQKAWECEKLLPILGRGQNAVPIINVADLASIIYNLVIDFPKKLYILAVEQNVIKQRELIKPLGRLIGSGIFKCIPPEDAFLIPEVDQRTYDLMTLNLNMEPTFIVETMGLQWTSELTFAENVPALMKQFRKQRGLKPFKVIVYGPPIVGKTTLSKLICETYGLVYISKETVIQDVIDELTWRINYREEGEIAGLGLQTGEEDDIGTDDDADAENAEGALEADKRTLALLRSGRELSEDEILEYLRKRLLCHESMNRGWVLDGFPTSIAECDMLFQKGEEHDSDSDEVNDEPFDEDVDLYKNVLKKILPDIVVFLDATDDYICEKAMSLPEDNLRLDEEVILKRLSEFRTGNAIDVSPLNFFDELEIHPLVVSVKDHDDYSMKAPNAAVNLRMGRPCRYPKLLALIEAAEKREKEELEALRAKEDKAMIENERKLKKQREERMEYWTELYSIMREEEEAALAAAGEPMRNYLMNNIFPTLTPALLEVAKLRPDDPIDFLAEYLFKLNPTGKMLEPGFNLQAEKLLGRIKILDDALKDLDIKIDPLGTAEAEISKAESSKKKICLMSAL
ncbi:hypothetical protein ACJJTC_014355 [Scirpophaga incertulas]